MVINGHMTPNVSQCLNKGGWGNVTCFTGVGGGGKSNKKWWENTMIKKKLPFDRTKV